VAVMHSALVWIKMPEAPDNQSWPNFLDDVASKQMQGKGVLRLAENVWLLDLQESLAPLGLLVASAEKRGLTYALLPFADAPRWLPASSDPSTILDRND
jgi:hypothetical protein